MDNVENIENNDDYGKTTFDQNFVPTTIGPVLAQQQILTQRHTSSSQSSATTTFRDDLADITKSLEKLARLAPVTGTRQ